MCSRWTNGGTGCGGRLPGSPREAAKPNREEGEARAITALRFSVGRMSLSVENGPVIYHTGDTDLFSDMKLIPQFRKVTLMLTCIGGHFTMGPLRAAEAVKLVNPSRVVPMHYGVFNLPGTPEAFSLALQQQGVKSQLKVMKVGEVLKL